MILEIINSSIFKWVVTGIVLFILINELAFHHWRVINPGSLYGGEYGRFQPIQQDWQYIDKDAGVSNKWQGYLEGGRR